MCGIAGIISQTAQDLRAIQAMTARQIHRGPDGGGLLFHHREQGSKSTRPDALLENPILAHCALGHRRLAIIDTSDQGLQPMQSKHYPHLWISYNGEIYNYRELRDELQALGIIFITHTDTEVILHAFAMWGHACFAKFRGMWAMAILDTKTERLTLCRDRFGIKPLYYHTRADRFVFASEIKALFALSDIKPKLNPRAAKSYLMYRLVDHTSDTFFDGIYAFPPAHYAIIALDAPENFTPIRYWNFPHDTMQINDDEAAKSDCLHYLRESIKEHLHADVAVGACLSGGIDSSAIVSIASDMLPPNQHPFHTFTATFAERNINESFWAELVNKKHSTAAHYVSPKITDVLRDIDTLIWHQDEPFSSASIFAQWAVMRSAKEAAIPVLLDGQGADEIFCGYKKFTLHHLLTLFKQARLFSAMRELILTCIRGDRGVFRINDFMRYLPLRFRRDVKRLTSLMTDDFAATSSLASPSLHAAGTLLNRQIQDITTFSIPSLLRYEDRNSMAFSIESRVPFLDHRLVEWGLRLPTEQKLRGGVNKSILRRALSGIVPQPILNRRDKMGFGAPQERWLREGILSAFAHDIRSNHYALDALIKKEPLAKLVEHSKRRLKPSDAHLLFQLYILNRWMLRFDVTH